MRKSWQGKRFVIDVLCKGGALSCRWKPGPLLSACVAQEHTPDVLPETES